MKIGEYWKITSVDNSSETQKTDSASKKDNDFAAMLEDELSEAQGTDSGAQVSGVISTLPVAGVSTSSDDEKVSGIVEDIESIISKLQTFEESLKSDTSAKQVDKIVDELGKLADDLKAKAGDPSANSQLDDLTQEVQVAGYMESVKWRRGDYL